MSCPIKLTELLYAYALNCIAIHVIHKKQCRPILPTFGELGLGVLAGNEKFTGLRGYDAEMDNTNRSCERLKMRLSVADCD